MPSESDVPSASGIDSTEANETYHEYPESLPEKVEEDGIKDDAIVQDLELHFALWVRSALWKLIMYQTESSIGSRNDLRKGQNLLGPGGIR